MNNQSSETPGYLLGTTHPEITCVVCGASLYCTDHGYHEITYHCSSENARFWDYERGSAELEQAKEHWEKSKLEIFIRCVQE